MRTSVALRTILVAGLVLGAWSSRASAAGWTSAETGDDSIKAGVTTANNDYQPATGRTSTTVPEECTTKPISTQQEGIFIMDDRGKLHQAYDDAHQADQGQWMRRVCYRGNKRTYYNVYWAANVDPTDLARQALSQAQLPKPTIPISTEIPKITLVNYPIWMWVDAGIWKPVQATAAEGGLSVTVTAMPTQVVWDSGDSRASNAERYLTCDGPGEVRPEGATPDQLESGSDCIYRYVHTSGKEKDLTFNLSATVRWHATWKATNGTAGDLGFVSTASAIPVKVGEWQAVNDYPEEGP